MPDGKRTDSFTAKDVNINVNAPPRVTVVSPLYGGSYEMSFYAAQGISEAGFEACVYDSSVFVEGLRKRENDPAQKEAYAREIMRITGEAVLRTKPDIVFGMAQAPLNSASIRAFKAGGMTTAFWFVEDFRAFPYWKDVHMDYDFFFVIQRGPFIEKLNRGKGNGFYLPVAARIPPGKTAYGRQYSARASFAGAPYRNRVAILNSLADMDISVYGEDWDRAAGDALKKKVVIGSRRVAAEELRAIYSNSTVNINLYSSPFYDTLDPHRDFINPRAFEIPACSGFQLSDARDNIAEFFEPGSEIELFSSVGELRDKIKYYSDNPEKAVAVARAAFIRTCRDHTYSRRMAQAMGIITKEKKNARAVFEGAREEDMA
jgi:spore maturation protein CgeB